MTTTTMKKPEAEEAPSRLQLVREGRGGDVGAKLPERGRLYVDIDKVVPDPKNERKNFRDLDTLAKTIEAVGIIEPPTAVPLEDGRFMLTTGERRFRASKLAGLKRIHIIVGDPEEEQKRRLKSLVSNVQRADLGAVELSQALQAMKDDREDIKTNRDLAALIGKSEQWVGGMFKILSLPAAFQKKLSESKHHIPYDVAQEIARLDNESQQKVLLEEALKGSTVRDIREKARELKTKKKTRRAARPTQRKIPWGEAGGWVIIHHPEGDELTTDACIAALQEAIKRLKSMNA